MQDSCGYITTGTNINNMLHRKLYLSFNCAYFRFKYGQILKGFRSDFSRILLKWSNFGLNVKVFGQIVKLRKLYINTKGFP